MGQYIVVMTSMTIEADSDEEAIDRAGDGKGGAHWEAYPTDQLDAMPAYSRRLVSKALNDACDDIVERFELPDSGVRDALNLLVNVTVARLDHPGVTLDEVAESDYDIDPEELDGGKRTALQVIEGWVSSE